MSKNKNKYKYDVESDTEFFSRNGGLTWHAYSSSDSGWSRLVKKLSFLFSGYTNTNASNLIEDQVIKGLNSTVDLLLKERATLLEALELLPIASNSQRQIDPLNREGDGSDIVQIANYLMNLIDEAAEHYDDLELTHDNP